jgi:hypothetical protein
VTNLIKIAKDIDVNKFISTLEGDPTLWDSHTIRQDLKGSAHHDTKCVIFRGPVRYRYPFEITMEEWQSKTHAKYYDVENYFGPIYHDLMSEVLGIIGATEIGYVMAVSLQALGHIDKHIDEGAYADYYDRYHLVLKSDMGNLFINEDERVWMKEGELWKFNHRVMHYLLNLSTADRWHLIIDAKVGEGVELPK